jgi:hypothetical protein
MPSNKKRRIRERMQKTGETYTTALQHTSGMPRIKPGEYSGVPVLPPGRTSVFISEDGHFEPDDGAQPQFEWVDIQGEFDAKNLHRARVPATAFHDPLLAKHPSMPPDVQRVLTLGEYIDARSKQMGWKLSHLEPGSLKLFGKTRNVILTWTVA